MPVFTANVPAPLKIGDKIEIGGKIKENCRKMSVNLCAQEGEEPRDVVLHFDVRFHRDNIISLSRKNGVWIGSGNYDTNYNMFVPGTIFRIVFEIKDTDVITIYCQGKFHSNFLPKIPLSMARYIVAWGDVERITHCYFHLGNKALGDETNTAPCSPLPRQNPPTVGGDAKRWASSNIYYGPDSNIIYHVMPTGTRPVKISPRMPKKGSRSSPGSPQPQVAHSSNESSDDEFKNRHRENRTDRFFYETLMCPQTGAGFPSDRHRVDSVRRCTEYNRKYHRDVTDSEKIESEIYSEDVSKNESTVGESEDILPEIKRHHRKFAPFSQVVSFMEKNGKRN